MKNFKVEPKSNSLKYILDSLIEGKLNYHNYIETIIERVKLVEPLVMSFVQPAEFLIKNLKLLLNKSEKLSTDVFLEQTLFGIPVGFKDLYHVEGFPTRAGSKLPSDLFDSGEGSVVKRIRKAGAHILGKTVTTEFAYFAAGSTRNPNNIDYSPGGSSSGSAAAVAAGIVPLSFGTQTIGSIIRPAAFCGVVGFKPSQYKIPTDGIIPLSPTLDQVGYFTSDVESTTLVYYLLCGQRENPKQFYRLCIPEGNYLKKANQEILKLFEDFISQLNSEQIEIIKINFLDNIDEIKEKHYKLLSAEAAMVHKDWFNKFKNLYHPKTVELIESGLKITPQEIKDTIESREEIRLEMKSFFELNDVDAIITPSTVELPPIGLNYTGNPIMSLPWTFAGLPIINIPIANYRENLPFGVQIVGKYFEDEVVLTIAGIIERSIKQLQIL